MSTSTPRGKHRGHSRRLRRPRVPIPWGFLHGIIRGYVWPYVQEHVAPFIEERIVPPFLWLIDVLSGG